MKVYCPNCGTQNEIHIARGNGFKECTSCKMLLRYVKWRNQKAQLTGYLDEKAITKNGLSVNQKGTTTVPVCTNS